MAGVGTLTLGRCGTICQPQDVFGVVRSLAAGALAGIAGQPAMISQLSTSRLEVLEDDERTPFRTGFPDGQSRPARSPVVAERRRGSNAWPRPWRSAARSARRHLRYGEEALADPPYQVHRTARVPAGRRLSPGPSLAKLLVFDPLLFVRLLGVVRRFGIQVIHAYHYEGLVVALAVRRLTGTAVVYDAHTLLHAELPYYAPAPLRRVLRRFGRWLDAKLPARADHVVATTDEIRDFLCTAALAANHVSVIGNGIEDVDAEIAAAEAVVSAEPGSERVVFAGNLAACQGVDLLLRAFAKVAAARPRVELVLVTSSSFAPTAAWRRRCGSNTGCGLSPRMAASACRGCASTGVCARRTGAASSGLSLRSGTRSSHRGSGASSRPGRPMRRGGRSR